MKVILYRNDREEMGNKFESLIQNQLPEIHFAAINSVRQLSEKLSRPLNRISVIVIFAICEKDIDGLLTLKHLFDNIRLILVLSDRTPDMMTFGLQLNPCFISYIDSDFSDITSVLKKIYQRAKKALEWPMCMNDDPYLQVTNNYKNK